ncbi:hypothetical protein [Faecalibacter macacae]|uniref:Uncharacterized protein n=1 Tax=Faecalibacter macacae TaxID=1859289 RepID=A0A3L9M9K3_9FLAO|nr:hypothetical protein [Faecalibacter macacae]RLZ09213.1 hypothetical protein EAH69_08300 [Faecalibacter macacae]
MKKYLLGIAIAMSSASVFAQVGIGTDTPQAALDIIGQGDDNNVIDGVIAPRITGIQLRAKNDLYTTAQNGAIVYVTEADSAPAGKTVKVTSPGYFYYSHPEGDNIEGIWERMDSSSKFFYMPSVALPTRIDDARITDGNNTNFTVTQGDQTIFTVDLYNIFKEQFLKPVASSALSSSEIQNLDCNVNPSKGLCGFVSSSDKYEYYVTFIDELLFSNTSISPDGILSYQVDPNKIIRNGSFMNIVLKVK